MAPETAAMVAALPAAVITAEAGTMEMAITGTAIVRRDVPAY